MTLFGKARAALLPAARSRRRNTSAAAVDVLEQRVLLSAVTMTPYEQLMLELVNRARSDPAAEAQRQGLSSVNEGIAPGSISTSPKQPLAPDQILIDVSGAHSQDMLDNNYFAHDSQDGTPFYVRISDAGYSYSTAGENISRGGTSPTPKDPVTLVYDRHNGLFLSTTGHRQNLMNDAFRDVGMGISYGSYLSGGTTFHGNLATQDFASKSGNASITGVVYRDGAAIDDDFYSVGEQVASGTIEAVSATGLVYTAMLGPSGGYAIKVPDGTYTVRASGGTVGGTYTFQNVVVSGGRNVKVDFDTSLPADPPTPMATPDSLFGVLSDGRVYVAVSDGTRFVNAQWATMPAAANWQDVVAGDFNGDGAEDLAARDSAGYWTTWLADDGRFIAQNWNGRWSPVVTWDFVQVGDFDGNGYDDIIGRAQSGSWYAAMSNGSSFSVSHVGGWSTNVDWTDVNVGDFNGDGRSDVAGRASSGTWVILQSLAGGGHASIVAGGWSTNVTWSDVLVGDFNNDGKSDVIGRAGSGSVWLGYGSDSGFDMKYVGSWSTRTTWSDVAVGDFNGDGYSDLAGRAASGVWYVYLSNDPTTYTGFRMHYGVAWSPTVNWADVQIGDFDGDGRSDFAGRSDSGKWVVSLTTDAGYSSGVWTLWNPSAIWRSVGRINLG